MSKYSTATLRVMQQRNPERAAAMAREAIPIRGWLILLAIGVVVSPILMAFTLKDVYSLVFGSNLWAILDNPQHPFHDSSIKGALVFALIANTLSFLASVWLVVLFFRKKAAFVDWFIMTSFFFLALALVDIAWTYSLAPALLGGWGAVLKLLAPYLIRVCVWVPYLKRSDRAKKTFVR